MQHRYLPEANRVSVLTAVILLTYALTRLIRVPVFSIEWEIAGRMLAFDLNLNIVTAVLAAALSATGMDWMLRSHPAFQGPSLQHLLLPALTAWIISVPLYTLQTGVLWWLAFALGGTLLVLLFLAEYVVVDQLDGRYALATAAITALSYSLFLILVIALRFTGVRLFIQLPVMAIAVWLVSMRVLYLRMSRRWEFGWGFAIALVCLQMAAALHYWPLTPVQYGLAVTAPAYVLTALAANLADQMPARRAGLELAVQAAAIWLLAFFLG